MQIKSYKQIYLLLAFTVATIVAYFWFIKSPYFDDLQTWASAHFWLFISLLVLIKIAGIVWPPINGGLLTLGAIPVVGWLPAYLADLTGSTIGSSIAFFIARKWGLDFMRKIFDASTIARVQRVKIRPNREFEAVFVSRLLGGTLLELLSYGAGLIGIRFKNYLPASILSHIVIGVPLYYFANGIISGRNVLINFVLVFILMMLFFFARKRYVDLGVF